ncbi:MAG: hypothetical protein HQL10_03605 [Nitrospirae bacterium]|nr:hypothetical protein [Nitrospirota bacterium]
MKLGKIAYMVVLLTMFLLVGCVSSPVRYTTEEIQTYPLDIQEKIVKGEVATGMTYQQVRYAWEAPNSVKKVQAKDGNSTEEWLYSSTLGICKINLVFSDSKLSGSVISSGQETDNSTSPVRYTQDEIKSFPQHIKDRIVKGEVATSMTPLHVRYSWGAPDEVKTVKNKDNTVVEDWIFSSTSLCKTRLVFTNGKLSGMSLGVRK